jgi:hypothetical protein
MIGANRSSGRSLVCMPKGCILVTAAQRRALYVGSGLAIQQFKGGLLQIVVMQDLTPFRKW